MEKGINAMEIFAKEAPEVARAFNGLIQSLATSKGLDEKTKQLIYIAMKAAEGDHAAIGFHIVMAKKLGAKKEEIVDAILMTLTVCGIKGVASCLPIVVKQFEEELVK